MTARDVRLLDRPDGVHRLFWRLYYRALRLHWRAEAAAFEHRIMYGDPSKTVPRGILHVGRA